MTDNAWTISIVSGAVGGVIILLIISLVITSAVCFLQQRTKESIPQGMPLQEPPLSSHRQLLGLVPDRPIIPDDRRCFTEDYILPFLGHNLATNKNSRLHDIHMIS